jgi:hypothetical protein
MRRYLESVPAEKDVKDLPDCKDHNRKSMGVASG